MCFIRKFFIKFARNLQEFAKELMRQHVRVALPPKSHPRINSEIAIRCMQFLHKGDLEYHHEMFKNGIS
jgi:hypothetical protein